MNGGPKRYFVCRGRHWNWHGLRAFAGHFLGNQLRHIKAPPPLPALAATHTLSLSLCLCIVSVSEHAPRDMCDACKLQEATQRAKVAVVAQGHRAAAKATRLKNVLLKAAARSRERCNCAEQEGQEEQEPEPEPHPRFSPAPRPLTPAPRVRTALPPPG